MRAVRQLLIVASATATLSTSPAAASPQRAFLDEYCVRCHSDAAPIAGLALDPQSVGAVEQAPQQWETVVRKLRAGAMPPPGEPRPAKAVYQTFVERLEGALDAAAALDPNPGRTEAFHRLNRTEYHNAVRDLLELEVDVAELLPVDAGSYGFDNIAGVLGFSPALLERYLGAAKKISRLALGRPVPSVVAYTYKTPPDLSQDEWLEGMPFGTRGGGSFTYNFPQDGEYEFRILQGRRADDLTKPFPGTHTLELSLDGEPIRTFTMGNPRREGEGYRQWRERLSTSDDTWRLRLRVGAGPHEIRATFLKEPSAFPEGLRQPYQRPYVSITGGDTRDKPYLGSITIRGPFDAANTPAADTPSRRRILACSSKGEDACARDILKRLARQAYRRPVTVDDLAVLMRFFEKGRSDGGFDGGIEMALRWVLASPEFVLRVERDPADASPGVSYKISDLELASRLSFFLWSSLPDEELLALAEANKLSEPATLVAQVRRMLADERSEALIENFVGQWLHLRNVAGVKPNEDLFPHFGEDLRRAMRRETELLVREVFFGDRSVVELLNADYSFVNEPLARHYGMRGVWGPDHRRVQVSNEARRGLLGHGSILAVTAYPNRTSPVLRGKWILDNLLGTPPADPPPDVPALETSVVGKQLSMREATELHRADPACASCHQLMDPPGFALEQFDAIGRYRTKTETNEPIDASGELPDGTKFEGASGLREALLATPDQFVRTLTEKLMIYALGRGLEHYDQPTVRAIVRDAAKEDYRFTSILLGVVQSPAFTMRRAAMRRKGS